MFIVGEIVTRRDFGVLFTRKGLLGIGVEIGVHQGGLSTHILSKWNGYFHGVDPWSVPKDYESQADTLRCLGGDGNRERDYQIALSVLRRFRRVTLHRMLSEKAAELFVDGSVDWVYIDGNHHREHVEKDIRLWYPKLREGGILSGHDILCPGEINNGWGQHVQPVVARFAESIGRDIFLVVEKTEKSAWSYYLFK